MNCNHVANHEMYRGLHFSNIDFCIWPPGGINMSKNWKKSKYHQGVFFLKVEWNDYACFSDLTASRLQQVLPIWSILVLSCWEHPELIFLQVSSRSTTPFQSDHCLKLKISVFSPAKSKFSNFHTPIFRTSNVIIYFLVSCMCSWHVHGYFDVYISMVSPMMTEKTTLSQS